MKDVSRIIYLAALVYEKEVALAFQHRASERSINPASHTSQQVSSVPTSVTSLHIMREEGNSFRQRRGMAPSRTANARLNPTSPSFSNHGKTRRKLSSVPLEIPRSKRFFQLPRTLDVKQMETPVLSVPQQVLSTQDTFTRKEEVVVPTDEAVKATRSAISKMDVALFLTYFTNMFVVNLTVVTVPALAAANFGDAMASSAFESSVASMAPLGGAFGKVINGFICQKLGGRKASWIYLVCLAALSTGMSFTKSVGSIGMFLMGYEFLSSIQWTSMCLVLDDAHKDTPKSIARGVAILSLSSYTGALAAKTIGAALLNMSGCWRSVTRIGALAALLGASAMFFGISAPAQKEVSNPPPPKDSPAGMVAEPTNPISVLKSIFTNKIFWMIGIGHSLGYVIRGSDRLLVPFLHQATGFPRHICASLTSFVTLGLVLGLGKGTQFSSMESIPNKMTMLKKNYIRAIASFFGLGACALNVMKGWVQAPYLMAVLISALSCLAASSISFQFSQVPNLVSTNMFKENKAVALSLVDAAGFFFTSQVFAANTKVLANFGWSASWTFLAMFLGTGSALMMKYMQPVLVSEKKRLALAR